MLLAAGVDCGILAGTPLGEKQAPLLRGISHKIRPAIEVLFSKYGGWAVGLQLLRPFRSNSLP